MWPFKKKLNHRPPPKEDPASIGNLIVESGVVTREEFERLLMEFQSLTVQELMGEFFVRKVENFTYEQLKVLLAQQKRMRGEVLEHAEIMGVIQLANDVQERATQEVETFLRVVDEAKVK